MQSELQCRVTVARRNPAGAAGPRATIIRRRRVNLKRDVWLSDAAERASRL
jgi:hypothetical protein